MSRSEEVVNIASALSEMAKSRPYAMAVACPAGRDREGRAAYTHWTFQQLDRESDLLARGLTEIGVGRGVRTVLMVRPGLEFFAITFALFKAGAVPVLIDPGMGIKNLGRCLEQAKPYAFIGIRRAQLARKLFGWARRTVRVTVTSDCSSAMWPYVDRLPGEYGDGENLKLSLTDVKFAASNDDSFPIAATRSDDLAAILFTSGSTGPPKGVEYSHGIFAAQVQMLRDLYKIERGEIDLCTFPLFALFAPALGMTSVVPEMDATRPAHVDPVKIIDAIESFGATNMFGSPALLRRVGEYGAEKGLTLPSLRRVISAGAPVPARVLERFATMLSPGVQIFTPYGATESLPVASIGSDEILNETRHATDQGSGVCVGRPVAGMRVAIIKITEDSIPTWSDNLTVPEGIVGEIVVQGPVVTRRYFDSPESTSRAKIRGIILPSRTSEDASVIHRMGDLGYRDPHGRIWFCGRKSHRVTTSAGTLYTIPCEAVFNTHPKVNRTALIGLGPDGMQRPVLCIEPNRWPVSRVERDEIVSGLKTIGRVYDHTKLIDTFLFHKSFPVDIRHNAKIFREKLAVWASRRVR